MSETQSVFEFAFPRNEINHLLNRIDTPSQSGFQIRAVSEIKFWLKDPSCYDSKDFNFLKRCFLQQ